MESWKAVRLLLRIGRDGDVEAVGIDDCEVAETPGLVGGLVGELTAPRLDGGGELVHVLVSRAEDAEAGALLAVAPLGEVVLAQHELDGTGREPDPHYDAF